MNVRQALTYVELAPEFAISEAVYMRPDRNLNLTKSDLTSKYSVVFDPFQLNVILLFT